VQRQAWQTMVLDRRGLHLRRDCRSGAGQCVAHDLCLFVSHTTASGRTVARQPLRRTLGDRRMSTSRPFWKFGPDSDSPRDRSAIEWHRGRQACMARSGPGWQRVRIRRCCCNATDRLGRTSLRQPTAKSGRHGPTSADIGTSLRATERRRAGITGALHYDRPAANGVLDRITNDTFPQSCAVLTAATRSSEFSLRGSHASANRHYMATEIDC
jgi:hypothetical protein